MSCQSRDAIYNQPITALNFAKVPTEKSGRRLQSRPPHGDLHADNVLGLQSFWTVGKIKFDRLALVQVAISFALNRAKMDKHVLTGWAADKAVALGGVKPLHCSLFLHFHCSYC